MDEQKLQELRQLVEEVIYARTKKDAIRPLQRLKFVSAGLTGTINAIDPYLSGKLGEVIAYATTACGGVRNKQHWIGCVMDCWYVFESGVRRGK